jgi:hypothetical protein
MLSYAAALPRQERLVDTRRAMTQLKLNFIDIPIPETCLWDQFDDEQKQIVVEALARLLLKATSGAEQEQIND